MHLFLLINGAHKDILSPHGATTTTKRMRFRASSRVSSRYIYIYRKSRGNDEVQWGRRAAGTEDSSRGAELEKYDSGNFKEPLRQYSSVELRRNFSRTAPLCDRVGERPGLYEVSSSGGEFNVMDFFVFKRRDGKIIRYCGCLIDFVF